MNILFLTMSRLTDVRNRGIYTDLMRKFRDEGHEVYIVSPRERKFGMPTQLTEVDGVHILGVKTLNVQKTNAIEKGLGQVLMEPLFQRAIRKYLKDVSFDLVLYSTPPITFVNVIQYVKKLNPSARTYLLLKDIFPQNAVDLGMLCTTGLKGILYRWLRKKEKALYAVSDYIGCMSPANVQYVLDHNPEVKAERVEVAPNSLELAGEDAESIDKDGILLKYHLPVDKPVFIYGGNLGKPQGIPFLIQCLEANALREDCHFVVVGTGFEYPRLASWYEDRKPKNVTVMAGLPKQDYDQLVAACQIGMIFLDCRFTIPNFPSRLLSYLENRMPVLVCTDSNCDMGKIATENGFGLWCESNSVEDFNDCVTRLLSRNLQEMGERGYRYLCNNYLVTHTYQAIMRHFG